MSTRKIKDAKDLSTNELIYFKGHAQATYMSDGRTVEEVINSYTNSGGNYLPLTGGTITGDLTLTSGTGGYGNLLAYTVSGNEVWGNRFLFTDSYCLEGDSSALRYCDPNTDPVLTLTWKGDGTKFLSDDGTYKTISGGSGTVTRVTINGTSKNPSSAGVVDLGYINKQLSTSTASTMTLSPNVYYRNTSTSLSSLTITLGSVSNSNIINEYFVEFTTSSSGTTISLPSTIKWANGEAPTFEASTTYQISIVNNLGVVTKFK